MRVVDSFKALFENRDCGGVVGLSNSHFGQSDGRDEGLGIDLQRRLELLTGKLDLSGLKCDIPDLDLQPRALDKITPGNAPQSLLIELDGALGVPMLLAESCGFDEAQSTSGAKIENPLRVANGFGVTAKPCIDFCQQCPY